MKVYGDFTLAFFYKPTHLIRLDIKRDKITFHHFIHVLTSYRRNKTFHFTIHPMLKFQHESMSTMLKISMFSHAINKVRGQKPRRTKATKDRSPVILSARTETQRYLKTYFYPQSNIFLMLFQSSKN